ncbi:TetR/AcrR family transcriptional regulator [Nocardia rhamnosiphila]|uniref:TetR/AcrR family transcriptional regulator n=1 Tax=Nocardia rhamnosiphila TaxID=426716 RepID=UPI0033C921BB
MSRQKAAPHLVQSTDHTDAGAALVSAAWQVLERSGYRSLKIRQILDASQCSAGVFYRRFPSKAHLMLTLMRTQSEHAVRTVAGQLGGTDDPCEQLTYWLRFHIEVLYDRRRRSRALMFADPDFLAALPDAPREHRTGLYDLLVEVARRGARCGVFATADPDGDADAIYRLVRGLVYDPLAIEPTDPFEVTLLRTRSHAFQLLHCTHEATGAYDSRH